MRWRVLLSCSIGLVAASAVTAAELYKCKGESGETVFSDQACPGGETLPMRETPTYAAPELPAALPPIKGKEKKPEDIQYAIAVTQPGPDEVIRDNEGKVTIGGVVTPALYEDHRVQLMLDGSAFGERKQTASWSLTEVDRGEHTAVIAVVDKSTGKVVSSSPSRKFVLFRATAKQRPDGGTGPSWPSLVQKPQPGDPQTPPARPLVKNGPRK